MINCRYYIRVNTNKKTLIESMDDKLGIGRLYLAGKINQTFSASNCLTNASSSFTRFSNSGSLRVTAWLRNAEV